MVVSTTEESINQRPDRAGLSRAGRSLFRLMRRRTQPAKNTETLTTTSDRARTLAASRAEMAKSRDPILGTAAVPVANWPITSNQASLDSLPCLASTVVDVDMDVGYAPAHGAHMVAVGLQPP